MSCTEELSRLLKKLRLFRCAVKRSICAPSKPWKTTLRTSISLFRILLDEVERRDQNQLEARMRRANFESHKTFEDFDFAFNPKVPKTKLVDLATCAFVERKENALFIGAAGVGKSHLAQAIGHRACRAGHVVHYVGAHGNAQATPRGSRGWDSRSQNDALHDTRFADCRRSRIAPAQRRRTRSDLYEIVRQRYERGSILLTSNRDEAELAQLFNDPLLASAAMEARLLHRAHVLVLEGDSFRNPRHTARDGRARAPKEASR